MGRVTPTNDFKTDPPIMLAAWIRENADRLEALAHLTIVDDALPAAITEIQARYDVNDAHGGGERIDPCDVLGRVDREQFRVAGTRRPPRHSTSPASGPRSSTE